MDGVCHSWAAVFGWRLEVGSWRLGGQQQEDGFQSPKKKPLARSVLPEILYHTKTQKPPKTQSKTKQKAHINQPHPQPTAAVTHSPTHPKKKTKNETHVRGTLYSNVFPRFLSLARSTLRGLSFPLPRNQEVAIRILPCRCLVVSLSLVLVPRLGCSPLFSREV
jgi:hypothetical protein